MTEEVDKVRRTEHKILLEGGDDRLKGTRYLWLISQENLTLEQQRRFDQAYQQAHGHQQGLGLQQNI